MKYLISTIFTLVLTGCVAPHDGSGSHRSGSIVPVSHAGAADAEIRDQYNRIAVGMTASEVSKILGNAVGEKNEPSIIRLWVPIDKPQEWRYQISFEEGNVIGKVEDWRQFPSDNNPQ